MASHETTTLQDAASGTPSLREAERPAQSENSAGKVWFSFAAVTLGVIILAAIRWSLDHPFGIHWDEAAYFNDVGGDVQRARGMLLIRLAGRILKGYGHPPAYRIIALPFLTLAGFHTTVARMVSLLCFALSSWFIYLATRRIASRAAAAIAVLVFCLSPEVVSASIFFSTDAPLYLSTAATLYYVFVFWSKGSRSNTWIGFGLAMGLGFLAKTSFFIVGLPVLAFWLLLGSLKSRVIDGPAAQWRAGALAILVAAPWWFLHFKTELAYGQYARNFTPNSLGTPSLMTWMHWLKTVVLSLVGPALSVLLGLLVITFVWQAILTRKPHLTILQKLALGACGCAGIPIVLAQLSGTNHLLRHISPAMIPLAIAAGIISDKTPWIHSRLGIAAVGVLLWAQLLMILTPTLYPNREVVDAGLVNGALPWRVMRRFDQWNWQPLLDISRKCGVPSPKISVLGGGLQFNPAQIEYPWVFQGLALKSFTVDRPDVTWLWRSDGGGAIDWQRTMSLAGESDIVVTAPKYAGLTALGDDPDDRNNAEFSDRLSHDARFQTPVALSLGRFQPVDVLVFLKHTLVCQSGPTTAVAGKAHL